MNTSVWATNLNHQEMRIAAEICELFSRKNMCVRCVHIHGAVELVMREEGDESPLPEARHAGELRRAPALAGDTEAELAAGPHRSF
jgi:hypothetical protein